LAPDYIYPVCSPPDGGCTDVGSGSTFCKMGPPDVSAGSPFQHECQREISSGTKLIPPPLVGGDEGEGEKFVSN